MRTARIVLTVRCRLEAVMVHGRNARPIRVLVHPQPPTRFPRRPPTTVAATLAAAAMLPARAESPYVLLPGGREAGGMAPPPHQRPLGDDDLLTGFDETGPSQGSLRG